MKIIPVILSGGAGTRLWPLSRTTYPKQFLNLSSDDLSLIQETAQRIKDQKIFEQPIVICNVEHRFIVAQQLLETGIESPTIILEPVGRNTAPALTIAALHIREQYGNNALMLAMPSDHMIRTPAKFLSAVKHAANRAKKGYLMTFGIKPSHAETAYGYINRGAILDKDEHIYEIAAFTEKPDEKRARQYVGSGKYVWNSGIFLFSVESYLDEIKKNKPDIVESCMRAYAGRKNDLGFIRLDKESFASAPSISVDYAVMESTKKGAMIEIDCGWNDLGAWDALWNIQDKDENGNAIIGNAYVMNTKNSYIRSEQAAIGMLGVDNLIVIATKDAILIANKDQAQDIKQLVDKIKKDNASLIDNPPRVYRPWGYYESIDDGVRHQVKHLSIKPKEKLSLQMHHHRSEHWIVVRGTAKVILDDKEFTLSENQSFYVPEGVKHSLENTGKINLDIIEVQSGSYLGEDDIVRFEDKYNRILKVQSA